DRVVGFFAHGSSDVFSAREAAVHARADVLQTRAVAAADLGDAPAVVADVVEGLHDRGPVVVALAELDAEAVPAAILVHLLAAEFLDVELQHARTEDARPLLGPAVDEEVAEVEVPADVVAADLVEVAVGLERIEDEVVPDVLDG